tara:strand:+ start:391 stop:852 length:462 start_codon:yes stop_codon:yes gene_type:complete
MKKKRIQYDTYEKDNNTYMECKKCGDYLKVDPDVVAVTCSMCVNNICLSLMPIESFTKSRSEKTGRPPGWHWMAEFVDKDGNVFHKGKEQPDLKGTLKPTKIKVRKRKKRKRNKDEDMFALAKEYKNRKKMQKKILTKKKNSGKLNPKDKGKK